MILMHDLTYFQIICSAVIFGLVASENNSTVERSDLVRFLRDCDPKFDVTSVDGLFREVKAGSSILRYRKYEFSRHFFREAR